MSRDLEFDVQDTSVREAKHQSGGRASLILPNNLPMFRPKKKGVHTIDVIAFLVTDKILAYLPDLQYAVPGKWYGEQTYYQHGGIGVNNGTYACPAMTFGKRCPVCDDGAAMRNSRDDATRDRGYEIKAKQRQLFLVFDHDDPQPGIQLWEVAYHNFGKQLDEFITASRPEMKPKYKLYYHPTQGFTLRISASEESMGKGRKGGGQQGGGGGTYTSFSVVEMYPRSRPIPVEMFRHGIDLSAIPKLMPYADLLAVYKGHDVDEPDPAAGANTSYGAQTQAIPNGVPSDRGGDDPYAALFGGAGAQPQQPAPVQHHPNMPPQDGRGFPVYTQPGLAPAASAWDDSPASGGSPDGDDEYYADDEVEFEYRGQMMTGVVESVDAARRVVRVQIPGEAALRTVMFEDAKLVTQGGGQSVPTSAATPPVADFVADFAPPPRRSAAPVAPPPPAAPPVDATAPPPRRRAAPPAAAPAPEPEPAAPPPRTRTRQPAPAETTDDNPPAPRRRK